MWDILFKTPIINILFFFYHLIPNLGLAIILLTLFFRLILVPLTLPALKSSKKMKELQPEFAKLKKKYAKDQALYAQKQMELYREHGLNPTAGCLPILLSIPVMLALYQGLQLVLQVDGLSLINDRLYFDFLKISPEIGLNTGFLWMDLSLPDNFFILPVLTGLAQYFNSVLMNNDQKKGEKLSDDKEENKSKKEKDQKKKDAEEDLSLEEMSSMMQGQFKYMLPVMTFLISLRVPAGASLYWFISSLFGIIQSKLLIH